MPFFLGGGFETVIVSFFLRSPFKTSSAGLEMVFPSMGLVNSEIRNRLKAEKIRRKLGFCMRLQNSAHFLSSFCDNEVN